MFFVFVVSFEVVFFKTIMSNQVTYTLDQKYHIVVWSHKGYSYKQINDLFSKMFENKPAPSPNTIQRILENLRRYGCLVPKNHKRERKVRPIDPERERRNRRICECVEENPTLSLKEIAKEVGTSSVTVAKVLRTNKYQQYKIVCNILIFSNFFFIKQI